MPFIHPNGWNIVIDRIPLSLSGVALGLASLGTLMSQWSYITYSVCGYLSLAMVILLISRVVSYPSSVKEALRDPVTAGVSGTFPMTLMVLSTYLSAYAYGPSLTIWILAILMHLSLILYFTRTFILGLRMTEVFASHFIVYIGIVVASITCPVYGMIETGHTILWFGSVCLIPLMVLITYRYLRYRNLPKSKLPLLCIYCAPVSLCLIGYMRCVTPLDRDLIMILYTISSALYVFGLMVIIRSIRMRFDAGHAALTFPTVVCATATDMVSKFLDNGTLESLAVIETVTAIMVMVYVLIGYTMIIIKGPPGNVSSPSLPPPRKGRTPE